MENASENVGLKNQRQERREHESNDSMFSVFWWIFHQFDELFLLFFVWAGEMGARKKTFLRP